MSHFQCEHCGATITDTAHGFITGCEHYPIETREQPQRRTHFLELLQEYQQQRNPVTKSVTKQIIKRRVDEADFT